MKIILIRFLALALFLIIFVSVSAVAANPGKMIARIPYGSKEGELGVIWKHGENPYNECVRGIFVDKTGVIYLLDYVNGKIKKFSKTGELLALTEGRISNIQSFTVDDSGAIYVQSNDGYSRITKFGVNEQKIWSYKFSEVCPLSKLKNAEITYGVEFNNRFDKLVIGPENTIYVKLKGWENDTNENIKFTIVMTFEGKFVDILPSSYIYANNNIMSYNGSLVVGDDTILPTITVDIYSEKLKPVRRYTLDIKVDDGKHYKGYCSDGGIIVLPDYREGVITITTANIDKPIIINESAKIMGEFIVNRYNKDGKFMDEIRFLDGPFMGAVYTLTVSQSGVIYYLQYDKENVYVWAYDRK